MRIPKGGPITAATPPEFYDTATTRINLQGTGVPNPYNATTTTSYKTVLTQPQVETQTTTTRTPARITSRILRNYQPDPLGRMQVTNGSSILDVREQQPGTSTTVVRHTETMSPVTGQTEETSTRQTVTQREVQVMTPEVTQIGTERMPSTARQEQRTVTTYANAPRAEQRTTTTVTSPANDQRTTTTVTSPANNQRTVTTYGTSPDGDRRTTTTVTEPANGQRTVTTYSNGSPVYYRTSDGDSTRTVTRTEYNVPTTETVERMP